MAYYSVIVVAVIGLFLCVHGDDSHSGVDHLEHLLVDLNKDYKHNVAPRNLSVSVGINYLCAMLDERSQILTSRVFERYQWIDPRLSWDPSKYGGIELVHVPSNLVWVPDNMRALNAVEGFVERDDITVAIGYEGNAHWFPLASYKTFCARSSSYRTDPTYHCYIGFGPWSQGVKSLPTKLLFQPGVEIDDTLFYDQCPYIIGDHRAEFTEEKYDCCPESFKLLSFHFDLRRRGVGKGIKHGAKKDQPRDCTWPHC